MSCVVRVNEACHTWVSHVTRVDASCPIHTVGHVPYTQWGFYRNVIPLHWDCGKNPILNIVYLTGSHCIFPLQWPSSQIAMGPQRFNWSGPPPRTWNFLKVRPRFEVRSRFEVHLKIKQTLVVPRDWFKYKRSNSILFVTSIALICGRVWPQLLQSLAQSLIGSPVTLDGGHV